MTSTKPLISIVTPSYNQVRFLGTTIESVIHQNYEPIEYLIADGGSTDGSVDVIKNYQKRLKWWVSEKDKGQADAVNKGLARAAGEIIGWLNSDDVYQPGSLALVSGVFQDNPDASMVYGDVASIDGEGRRFNVMRFQQWGLPELMRFNIISQPGVWFRKSALDQVGLLNPEYHFLLDHHLWLRLARVGRCIYIPQILASARYHEAAKNIARAGEFGRDAYRILEWIHTQPVLEDLYQKDKKRILAGAHRFNARYLLDGGDIKGAIKFYWKSIGLYPPTGLREFHRIIYAYLAWIGMGKIKTLYYRLKSKKFLDR